MWDFRVVTQIIIHRRTKDADDPSSVVISYAHGSSITTLRGHLERVHLERYLKGVGKEWPNKLPSFRSLARSQATSRASASQVGRPDEFNEEKFHQRLLNFIVVDDQVRFRLLSFNIHYAYVSLFRITSL